MNWIKKFEENRKKELNKFLEACQHNSAHLSGEGFLLKSCEFRGARSNEDYIEVIFKNKNYYISIDFWIFFNINYEYNDDFNVYYSLYTINGNKKDIVFESNMKFTHVNGNSFDEKMISLADKISVNVNKCISNIQ